MLGTTLLKLGTLISTESGSNYVASKSSDYQASQPAYQAGQWWREVDEGVLLRLLRQANMIDTMQDYKNGNINKGQAWMAVQHELHYKGYMAWSGTYDGSSYQAQYYDPTGGPAYSDYDASIKSSNRSSNYQASHNTQSIQFKENTPIQTQELDEIGLITTEKIRNIADGVFVESGELIKSGQVTFSTDISYVSLNSTTLLNEFKVLYDGNPDTYIVGKYITDGNSRIKARVIAASPDSYQGETAENHSLTLFLTYIYSDGDQATVTNIFQNSDNLYILKADGTADTGKQIGVVGSYRALPRESRGKSSIAQIKEGHIYANGMTIKVWPQTLVVDKYGTLPSYRIGLVLQEFLVSADDDPTLRDPSFGPNEGAPGADRMRAQVILARRELTSRNNENFLDLLKVVNGEVQWKNRYIREDASKSDIVESEYIHRGDKVIKPFNYEIREHLNTNTDYNSESGLYTTGEGGLDTLISLGVSDGEATVNGKGIKIQTKQRINIEKPRTVKTRTNSTSVAAQVGNYVVTDGGIDITQDTLSAYNNEYSGWMYISPKQAVENSDITKVNLRKSTATAATVGTARIRDIVRFNDEYKIYLYDIQITHASLTLKDVEEITTATNDYKIADINTEFTQTVIQSHGASETAAFADDTQFGIDTTLTSLNETSLNKNLFRIPKEAVYHDSGVSSVVINRVRTSFFVAANGSLQLIVGGLGAGETFDDSNLSSTRNVDVLVYGADGASSGKMWKSSELVISYNGAKTQMTITEDGTGAFQNGDNYVIIAPIKLSTPVVVPKTLKYTTKNVTTILTSRTIDLVYGDVIDKNWKVYENGNGFSTNATASDIDVTSRYEMDTGQRDNSYEAATLKLKDEYPLPSGSLRIEYFYLQWGTDAEQYDEAGQAWRVGDYISVDSYPVGSDSAPAEWTSRNGSAFGYADIPVYTSPSLGEKFRLSDVIDFRPLKNSDSGSSHNGVVVKSTRTPYNTTVDIGQLKYYQPRIDKVYLTEGSTDPEIIDEEDVVIGEKYKIVSKGTSNFVNQGSVTNSPDEIFIADTLGGASGTGKLTKAVGNLRVIKGTPYDGDPVVPDDPKVGLSIFEVKVPGYTFSSSDVIVKPIDNVERKNIDIAKYEKIIENLQRQASVDPLEAKADSYDIGSGRKKVGHFFDSFEGQEKSDVLLKEYSASIDRFRNELRPEYSVINLGVKKTPSCANSLYDPQTGGVSDKELISLPLNVAENYVVEVQNPEASMDLPLRTTHTDVYNGYMKITPDYDNWKSTKSRPDLIKNKNGEFDAIKHHPTAADVNGMVWEDWKTHWSGFSKNEFEDLSKDTPYKDIFNDLKKSYEVESNSIEVAGKHVLTDYVPYIRSQTITISAYGLRPNTSNIRITFDGIDITSDVYSNTATSSTFKNTTLSTLRTDDYGRFIGSYIIPNVDAGVGTVKFKAGKKLIVLDSTNNDVDCYSEAIFNAVGYVDNKVSTRNLERSWEDQTIDTLSQGIEIFDDCFVKKVDLYFIAKESFGATRPVILQLRKLINGKPSKDVLPFSTVVKNPTDTLNVTTTITTSHFTVGTTIYGNSSGASGKIISKASSNTQITVNTTSGKFIDGEEITDNTNTYTLNGSDGAVVGIEVDGTTPTTFEFSECVYLPRGKYCITIITPSPLYKIKALDLNSQAGSRMTGVGQLYQGYDLMKGQLIKFRLWRAKFDTTITAAESTADLVTSTLSDISLEANPLESWNSEHASKNIIRVHQKNHGHVSADTITFGGVVGTDTVDVDLTNLSSGNAADWKVGEIIYQHSADVTGNTVYNYPHGILLEISIGSPNTMKVAMLSTDSFTAGGAKLRQVAAKLIGTSTAQNADIVSTPNFNQLNKKRKRLNGIDVEYINNGAAATIGSASGSANNNPTAVGSGYTDGDNFDVATTGGSGTGLTVRFTASGNAISSYNSGTKAGGIHIVNPGTGYVAGDVVTVSGGTTSGTVTVVSVNTNEYTVQSTNITHDYYEVKRTGSGNVGSTGATDITSYSGRIDTAGAATNSRAIGENGVVIKADTGSKGPRVRADLIYHSDTSIIPEDTTLDWSNSLDDGSSYDSFTKNANKVLDATKYVDDTVQLRAVFDSSNDRVSPVVDKSMLNLTLVNNRMDSNTQAAGTFETSAYISRKTTLKESANSIKVVTDAIVPKNSTIELWCRVDNATSGDKFNDLSWTQIPQISVITTDDSDTPVELSFIKDDLNIFSIFQIKVVFKSSDTSKVPRLKNIMAIANYKDDLLKPMKALTLNIVRTSVTGTEDHTIPTEFTVKQGNVFLIDYDSNYSYSSNGTVEFLRDADGSIAPLNSTLNTGCTVRFTSTSGTNSFRAVVIIFGR